MAKKGRKEQVPPREKTSAYTIYFPRPLYHSVKVLAAVRGQSIREFLQTTVHAEVTRAVDVGEFDQTRIADVLRHRA